MIDGLFLQKRQLSVPLYTEDDDAIPDEVLPEGGDNTPTH